MEIAQPKPKTKPLKEGRFATVTDKDGINVIIITKENGDTEEPIDISRADIKEDASNPNNKKTIYTIETPEDNSDPSNYKPKKEDIYTIDKNGNFIHKTRRFKPARTIPPIQIPNNPDDPNYIDPNDPNYAAEYPDFKKLDYSIPINEESSKKQNQDLLEIFDKGINDIVLRLKARFGENNKDVNEVVKAVSSIFGEIDKIIEPNTGNKAIPDYADNILVSVVDKDTGEYTSDISTGNTHIAFEEANSQFGQVKDLNSMRLTLDDNAITNTYTTLYEADPNHKLNNLNMNNPEHLDLITTRLKNCQSLEIFHLKLYENFMKTGAFTLSLYEKYKYVTNVMLYLFKNLVNKPKIEEELDTGCSEPLVRLPKTIIVNIAELVKEQGRIQGTIDSINQGLKQTQLDKMYNYGSKQIDTNLKDAATPNQKSETYVPPISTRGNVAVPEIDLQQKVANPDIIDSNVPLQPPLPV